MKKLFCTLLASLSFLFCFSQTTGKYPTFAGDDFSADQEGIWWVSSQSTTAVLTKDFDSGKLSVELTNSSTDNYGFVVSFPDNLDLSQNAVMSLRLQNLEVDSFDIVVSLHDINGTQLDAVARPSGQDDAIWAVVYGKSDTTLSFDFSAAKVGEWHLCSPCSFDFENVTGVNFIINHGAGIYRDIPAFTGTVLLDDFSIGAIPCGTVSGDISGPVKVCNQSEVSYTIPQEVDAISYRWEITGDAQILYGQGTDSIRIKAGTSDFQLSAVAEFPCGDGRQRNLTAEVHDSVGIIDGVIMTQEYCGYTSGITFNLVEYEDVEYTWTLPDTISFTGEASPALTVDMPNGPGNFLISGSSANACGTRESIGFDIQLTEGPVKPVLVLQDETLIIDSVPQNVSIKWYKYGEELSGETGESITVSETALYAAEFNNGQCASRSDDFFVKVSGINGIGPTYARDDFSSTNGYINTNSDGFMVWWMDPSYEAERNGDGRMKISTSQSEDFGFFGVSFESSAGGIDLSADANLHFIVENVASQEVELNITLMDIDGRITNILPDTSSGINYSVVTIPANTTETIDIDFTGAYAIDYVNCIDQCPKITDDFNFHSVSQVHFIFNIAASTREEIEPFSGSVYFKDFLIGNYIWQDGDSLATVNASNIQWEKDGEEIPGANSQKIAISGSGGYSVKLTDTDNSLHVSRLKTVNDVLGATTSAESSAISVYPNPSSGLVSISAKEKVDKFELADLSGKVLLTGTASSINTESLEPGTYVLTIHSGGQVFTKRLIRN